MIELLEKWQWWNLFIEEINEIASSILSNNDLEFVKKRNYKKVKKRV